MKKNELSKLYWIQKEVRLWNSKLQELEASDGVGSPTLTAAPAHSGKISDITAQIAIQRAEIKIQIEKLKLSAAKAEKEILQYIQDIPDPYIRQIMTYRCIDNLHWEQIADRMGGTGEALRQTYSRYVNDTIDNPNDNS